MIIKVPKKADWLVNLPEDIFNNKNFIRIYDFFVVHSIVDNMSARGKKLDENYHWYSPWEKGFYLNRQLKELATDENLLYSADVYEQKETSKEKSISMEEALLASGLIDFPNENGERICIYNYKNNQILSTFAHIRNSFAHCRYNILDTEQGRMYYFEDVKPYVDPEGMVKLTARIQMYESTMLHWIALIESGEKEYEKAEGRKE